MSPVIVALIVLNVASFATHGLDKALARLGGRRVPEKTLLVLMMGGVAGSLLGMAVFRHKTSKSSYHGKAIVPFLVGVAVLALGVYLAT